MNLFFQIENFSSKPSERNNKISIAEIETQQEFANFDEVKPNNAGSIF